VEIVKVRGAAFVCEMCGKTIPKGEIAHILMHIEVAPQAPAEIHVGFAPNEKPDRVIIVPRMAAVRKHTRGEGRFVVLDRKECDPCNTLARLAVLAQNCCV